MTLPSYSVCRVVDTEQVTPRMRRIAVESEALRSAVEVAPDQQVKLFFSRDGSVPDIPQMPDDGSGVAGWYARYLAIPEPRRPWMRSYTVRHLDPARGRLWIDFVLHGDGDAAHTGPASRWAAQAGEGDVLGVLGPATSRVREPSGQPVRLLVGDETALPAIGATVEALPAELRAVVVVEVQDSAEEQRWESAAQVSVRWVHRSRSAPRDPDALLAAVREVELPDGPVFAWVAGEASAVRAVRRHLVGERGIDKRSVSFTGYWRRDLAEDDELTTEDMKDREELMAEIAE